MLILYGSVFYTVNYTLYYMLNSRGFIEQNVEIAIGDALALWLAVSAQDEIPVRQLLREFESAYPVGYGKQILIKTLPFLSYEDKDWLRQLY